MIRLILNGPKTKLGCPFDWETILCPACLALICSLLHQGFTEQTCQCISCSLSKLKCRIWLRLCVIPGCLSSLSQLLDFWFYGRWGALYSRKVHCWEHSEISSEARGPEICIADRAYAEVILGFRKRYGILYLGLIDRISSSTKQIWNKTYLVTIENITVSENGAMHYWLTLRSLVQVWFLDGM